MVQGSLFSLSAIAQLSVQTPCLAVQAKSIWSDVRQYLHQLYKSVQTANHSTEYATDYLGR